LTAEERIELADSLSAYRAGDVVNALARYPAGRPQVSDAERIYHAALLLSVGQAEQSETTLALFPRPGAVAREPATNSVLASALRQLIAAVKQQTAPSVAGSEPGTNYATELLAASYYEQSRGTGEDSLRKALQLAREAANKSPSFGFAW